jgi:copper homeostasis protein (lipoprotein)
VALIVGMKMHRLQRAGVATCAALAACMLAGCAAPRREPGPSAAPRERAAVPAEPRRLIGLYRYRADAASFFDCGSGDQFPVAPGGQAPALQAAYAAARAVPGEPQLASVVARIVMRALEPGGAPRPALQIERVIGLSAQTQCAAASR